ncbi:MAG: ATP-binding protein [Candidatus Accumulibacter propinquus]|jgi:hypothetical protein|uniref:ATP-binding protein n=1 Tax=Candidatus Accumulibacter propinquus TaxID=2954380 RepID=UPI002FC341CA
MDQRYTQGLSTIITTNLELPDWYELFQKKALVDALIDRLQHRCILLRLSGPSLRNPPVVPTTSNTDTATPAVRRSPARKKSSPDAPPAT